MRAETQEAMRMFLGGRCYTAKQLEKDYLSEVAGYSDDRWEAPVAYSGNFRGEGTAAPQR